MTVMLTKEHFKNILTGNSTEYNSFPECEKIGEIKYYHDSCYDPGTADEFKKYLTLNEISYEYIHVAQGMGYGTSTWHFDDHNWDKLYNLVKPMVLNR